MTNNNIYDKLIDIQGKLKAPKGQYNSFGNYNYRSAEDILEAVKPHLQAHSLVLIISDEAQNLGDRYYIKATATLRGPDGQEISTTAYAREPETKKGMDQAQITGATSSYARKYALNGLFAIDDNRDPDFMDNRNEGMPQNQSKMPQNGVQRQNRTQTSTRGGQGQNNPNKAPQMTLQQAQNLRMTGNSKHAGKSLQEIFNTDRQYIDWLAKNWKEPIIKTGAKMLLAQGQQARQRSFY